MADLKTSDVKSLLKINLIPHYWESLKPQNDVGTSVEDAWKKKVEFMDEVSVQNNAVVFLWNSFTNRFLYMSDKLKILSGLEPSSFTAENGVEYVLSQIHESHVQPVLQLIQKLVINYCAENNVADYKSVKICFNYLFKNGNGEYVQTLQRPVILEVDENNRPSLVLNFTYHVDYIKRQNSVGGMVIADDKTSIFNYNLDEKCIEPSKTFSDQEMKILQLLGKGFDTKAIAEKLFISPHTVDTHRRNLIKKTNCMDTTGVVTFARMIGLI
jgi:DNA-binding CsgD family transcriptional regulator